MIYKVQATFKEDTAHDLFLKLTDGTVSTQEPDGQEIVNAMRRARVHPNGDVIWYEMCFCSVPLQHERETVLDDHFENMIISEAHDYGNPDGEEFWDHMVALASKV